MIIVKVKKIPNMKSLNKKLENEAYNYRYNN